MSKLHTIFTLILCCAFLACGEDTLPKPKSQLSLSYPAPVYATTSNDCAYTFDKNNIGTLRLKNDCSAVITYPKLNGSIFLTYREVNDNITDLLRDAQKLTYEHTRKADAVDEKVFINHPNKAYGMFYELKGNAASQSQFYITDSINHFLTGSIYFNTKPNYDSIYPAAAYLKNDIRRLMESITWQN